MKRLLQIVFVMLLTSCSGTQLDRQMRAADMIGISANKAEKFWIDTYLAEARRAADAAGTDVEARLAAVHRVQAQWTPVSIAWEIARRDHDAYAACLEAARLADGGVCPDVEALRGALEASIYTFRCTLRAVGHSEIDPIGGAIQCSAVDASASPAPEEQ